MSTQDPPGNSPASGPVRLESILDAPRITALYRYWNSKRGERPLPSRADIDPVEIKPLLPGLFMIEVLEDPRRFRYRLIGTDLVTFSGRDSTGRMIDSALYGEAAEGMVSRLNEVVEGRRPMLSLSSAYWLAQQSWNRVALLFLPLAVGDRPVGMILGGMTIDPLADAPADPKASQRYILE